MHPEQELRLAVLIDADNVPRKALKSIMEEIAVYGNATIKRIYGDWTTPNLGGWKAALLENAITPIQQYAYTTGKNSTDSAMIIDAMDVLYSGRVDGFCLVSSDSDFTRLAMRLREAGMRVIGLGEKKTPNPFIVACDRFIYIEVIAGRSEAHKKPAAVKNNQNNRRNVVKPAAPIPVSADNVQEAEAPTPADEPPKAPREISVPKDVLTLIAQTIDDVGDEEGWAYLGEVGSLLQKKRPDFDSRNYGFKKLSSLLDACDDFEVDFRQNVLPSNGKLIYIRNRKQ